MLYYNFVEYFFFLLRVYEMLSSFVQKRNKYIKQMEVKYKIKIPIGSALLMKYMKILLKLNAISITLFEETKNRINNKIFSSFFRE